MVTPRDVVAFLFFLFYGLAGVTHFTNTAWHVTLVPPTFGNGTFWVYVTGVIELLMAFAMLFRPTRARGSQTSVVFLVAVYPANAYMWYKGLPGPDGTVPSTEAHVLRLIFQLALIAASAWLGSEQCCVVQCSRDASEGENNSSNPTDAI